MTGFESKREAAAGKLQEPEREALKLALEALESSRVFVTTREKIKHPEGTKWYDERITAIKEALAQPAQEPVAWMVYTQDGKSVYVTDNPTDIQEGQRALPLYTTPPLPAQEPVAWKTMEAKYPSLEKLDIRMGDGSILCDVWPQSDGDLWWEGSGTGEKFIDPKYANVTHWRIHAKHTAPPQPAQEPTSGDYALGYAEGFNDACKKPAQEPVAFAGIEMWVGGARITRHLTQTELHYARDPWMLMQYSAELCLAKLKERNHGT